MSIPTREDYEQLRDSIAQIGANLTHSEQDKPNTPPLTEEQREMITQLASEGYGTKEATGPRLIKARKDEKGRMIGYADVFAVVFAVSALGLVTILTMFLFFHGIL